MEGNFRAFVFSGGVNADTAPSGKILAADTAIISTFKTNRLRQFIVLKREKFIKRTTFNRLCQKMQNDFLGIVSNAHIMEPPLYALGPGGGLYLDYTGGRREMQEQSGSVGWVKQQRRYEP